ncbi:hypothetical protein AAIL08_000828 [Campylobacter upsaliensis]|uniref:hypothetical protein n=1 Tax=Campylobacter upsaliensis TaxID=28080 RepID=UPI00128A7562|nr:hypothetical protein [Campylobacter upsaliensis]EAI2894098.1 hypothetical protein [Campylobacter upsaliensis]EAI3338406.1 hypothetical protein [Campylobacter upsaliensis]EAI3916685.1 hypothetical protein [Campylobacter upsaliensis]EAI4456496.1 hypothetical protein [Campylobacter upsaliensis]EAI5601945.1 hypothetical protein [Campylobacter upsaliensis]
MKKTLLLSTALFFAACSNTSSNFVHVSMPNFKPQTPTQIQAINSGIKIALEPLALEQNNNYSDNFENSVLKIRIDKENELLKQNLEEQIKTIAKLKGYELDNTNPDYKLKGIIKIFIDEKEIQKTSEWLSGDSIDSKLGLKFEGKIEVVDAYNPQNKTKISSDTKLDSFIDLTYPIKSSDGVGMFKTTLSNVPTQLNKGLERPAFEIDKAYLAFYKNTLNSLHANLPKALDLGKSEPQNTKEYNEFINEGFSEENPTQQRHKKESQMQEAPINSEEDGVIIFE